MQKVPGPKGSLFLGNAKDFADTPPVFLHKLHEEYGEITAFKIGPQQCYSLANPEHVEELLIKKPKLFEKSKKGIEVLSRTLGKGLVTSTGELHKQQRKLMQPAFRKKYLDGYAEAMIYFTEQRKNMWSPGQQIDLVEEMMELTMFIVAKTLFNIDMIEKASNFYESFAELQELTMKEFSSPFVLPTWFPTKLNRRRKELLQVMDATIYDIIKKNFQTIEKTEGTSFNLMEALFETAKEEGFELMDNEQLRDELMTLFLAGHETTANALAWAWYEILRHPEVETKLHQEIDQVTNGQPITLEHVPRLTYTAQIFKEAMRLYPPAWTLVSREPQETTEIGDYELKKGSLVFISPYVLHRNRTHFPEPEAFRPERFEEEAEKELPRHLYIPFGTGHRICIGRSFAMMEGILLLASIAQQFCFQRLSEKPVELNAQVTLSLKGGLPVKILQRNVPRT